MNDALSATLWDTTLSWSLIALCALGATDLLLARHFVSRWFLLHTTANLIITLLCVSDTWFMLSDPVNALQFDGHTTQIPLAIVFALHCYHMIPGLFQLYWVDWVHHILMCVIGNPLLMFANYGPLLNYNFMWVCGLPGGVDYLMLCFVKEGKMAPLSEKRTNTVINLWVRGPALCFSVVFSWIQIHMQYNELATSTIVIRVLLQGLQLWNAQYFLERVVANYHVTSYRLSEASKGEKKISRGSKELSGTRLRASLNDGPDDHPLPSMPGADRRVRFKEHKSLWKDIKLSFGS